MGESREVGRYEILERIGSGGMAVVHLARQRDLDRLVALKELSAPHAEDPDWASRFLRESRLAGSLTHANIVTVFDYFEAGGTPFIAMEYLERGSLRPFVGALELPQIAGVLADVLAGLGHAGRRGIVHRDLKPENLLVSAEGQAKIADFGIAKATSQVSAASFNTQAGVAVGTPGYMSPEQAMARDIGPWSDLYSVGCMAYEMLTGALPFAETTEPFALMMRHIGEPIPAARAVNPSIDRELSGWIDLLLAKDPADRVRSAEAAWDALDEILFRMLGPRWQRTSALPLSSGGAPSAHWTSAVIDVSRIPQTLPGPYTPPPSDAVVSAQIAALDPDTYVSVDVHALRAPARTPSEPLLTPAPAGPAPPPPTDALIAPPALVGVDSLVLPGPETRAPVTPRPALRQIAATRRVLPVVVAGVALVVVLIVVLSSGGSPPPPASTPTPRATPGPRTLSSGPLSARVPGAWADSADSPEGFGLSSAAAAKPPGGEGAVVIGLAPASSQALLPGALLESGKAPERTEVALGSARAYRYDALPGGLVVYAVPTDQGVATVVCESPAAKSCGSVAQTLKIGAKVLPLGPDSGYAAAVNAALARLSLAALRSARTPNGQAQAAHAVSRRYASAAKALRATTPGPAEATATAALIQAFDDGSHAFARLASAAGNHQRPRYHDAAGDADAARGHVGAALDDLADAGYHLRRPSSAAIPSLAQRPAKKNKQPAHTSRPTASVATPTPQATVQPTRTAVPHVTPKPTPIPAKPTPVPAKPTPQPIDG